MWRLFNFLFGWDYVQLRSTVSAGIARVRVDHSGKAYYYRYAVTRVIDVMTDPKDYIWLTCSPHKYFPADGLNDVDILSRLKP